MIEIVIRNISFSIPESQDELTIGQFISFHNQYGKDLEERAALIQNNTDEVLAELDRTELFIDKCFCWAKFFCSCRNINTHIDTTLSVKDATTFYHDHIAVLLKEPAKCEFFPEHYSIGDFTLYLSNPELNNISKITFGEFIDSKILTQSVNQEKQSKWHLIQYIAAIFLREKGQAYQEASIDESCQTMTSMPISTAFIIGEWFEQFNIFIEQHFDVFSPSKNKSGRNVKAHFKQWGWINFLMSIAKTKVFDIPNAGLNSIECARKASCYDVLVFASEEKSYNEALMADMDTKK